MTTTRGARQSWRVVSTAGLAFAISAALACAGSPAVATSSVPEPTPPGSLSATPRDGATPGSNVSAGSGVSAGSVTAAETGEGTGTSTAGEAGGQPRRAVFGGGPLGTGAGGVDSANLITGTITAVSDTSITVNTQRGPLRVVVDGNTRVTRNASGSIADLAAGDSILVTGQRSDDGVISAAAITVSDTPLAIGGEGLGGAGRGPTGGDGQPGFFFRGPGPSGTPQTGAPQGQAFPFQGGFQGGAPNAEQLEEFIAQAVASGRMTEEQAAQLRERVASGTPIAGGPGRLGGQGPGNVAVGRPTVGRVVEIGTGSMTVETADGNVTVIIDPDTPVRLVESPAPSELAVGTSVSVAAERGADGVVRATAIIVGN